MKAVKVRPDGSIKLPQEVLQLFPHASELGIWTQGDVIVLKRLQPSSPSQIAKRVPEEEMPLDEITAEVHRLRKEKRKQRG